MDTPIGRPAAVINLATPEGVRLVQGQWRYSDVKIVEVDFIGPGPDGLIVDREGNLIAARPGGINVFAPDGSLLGSIETGVATSHSAWGDEGSTLYITASSAVFRIRLSTRGIGFEKGLG